MLFGPGTFWLQAGGSLSLKCALKDDILAETRGNKPFVNREAATGTLEGPRTAGGDAQPICKQEGHKTAAHLILALSSAGVFTSAPESLTSSFQLSP